MRTGRTIGRKPAWLVVALAVVVIASGCAGEADGADDALGDRGTDDTSSGGAEASTNDPTTTEVPTTTSAPTTDDDRAAGRRVGHLCRARSVRARNLPG